MIVRKDDGLWWPESDVYCMMAMRHTLTDIQHIIPYVKDFATCIQAGGNVGTWPIELARYFGNVYTFEPDVENFDCLDRNVEGKNNIHAFNSALGDKPNVCTVSKQLDNCGAARVSLGGNIPVITIDHLELTNVGLIQLDVEGMELPALKGAEQTIRKWLPVICLEINGLNEKYGYSTEDLRGYLHGFGYAEAKNVNNDFIFTRSN